MKYALWTVQVLLAALFLFGGVVKLTMPIEEMTAVVPLPGLFIQFIAVCEVLGSIGLVIPGLTRIQPILTPIAAAGLVIIMVGATVITAVTMDVPSAVFPFVDRPPGDFCGLRSIPPGSAGQDHRAPRSPARALDAVRPRPLSEAHRVGAAHEIRFSSCACYLGRALFCCLFQGGR